MAKIVVTGGSGKVGRFAVRELLAHGYDVLNVDQQRPAEPLCPFMKAGLTELGQVYGALRGAQAVIHLAAIPYPGGVPPEVVFGNNIMSTFNVVEAAIGLGLERVVFASSDSALGFPYASKRIVPEYVPVDEEHPVRPQDPYGLSKLVGEDICRAASRRSGMPTVALRFSWVNSPDEYVAHLPHVWDNPQLGPRNLWSYVDARDAARACRLALEARIEQFEAFHIAAADSYMNVPTPELFERHFPEVSRFAAGWGGYQSSLTCRKAEALLGYRPEHSWRDHVPLAMG